MKCPSCHKSVSKALNQFGRIKTCEFCNGKFKIRFKWKEIGIYAVTIGLICAALSIFIDNEYLSVLIIVVSFPLVVNFLYKTEAIIDGSSRESI